MKNDHTVIENYRNFSPEYFVENKNGVNDLIADITVDYAVDDTLDNILTNLIYNEHEFLTFPINIQTKIKKKISLSEYRNMQIDKSPLKPTSNKILFDVVDNFDYRVTNDHNYCKPVKEETEGGGGKESNSFDKGDEKEVVEMPKRGNVIYDKTLRREIIRRRINSKLRRTSPPLQPCKTFFPKKKQENEEERRVVYIGNLPHHVNSLDLEKKMKIFGKIIKSSIHQRNENESYGFVTFETSKQAAKAKQDGKKIRGCEDYDFSYGERRQFCGSNYADLDYQVVSQNSFISKNINNSSSFQDLLSQALNALKQK